MDLIMPVTSLPFMERFNDYVAGVALDAQIVIFEDVNACVEYPTPTPTSTPGEPTPTPTNTETPTPTPSETPGECKEYELRTDLFAAYYSYIDCYGVPQTWSQPFGSLDYRCAIAGTMVLTSGEGTITDLGACPTPTPTPTPTNTPNLSPTPTSTLTPTPSATPAVNETQYLEVLTFDNTKFRLILWNDIEYSSPATATCDYVVSGCAYGDLGTIYCGEETINQGQHQHQFNLAPVLLPGEVVTGFTVQSYYLTGCTCVVNLIFPTPAPTFNNLWDWWKSDTNVALNPSNQVTGWTGINGVVLSAHTNTRLANYIASDPLFNNEPSIYFNPTGSTQDWGYKTPLDVSNSSESVMMVAYLENKVDVSQDLNNLLFIGSFTTPRLVLAGRDPDNLYRCAYRETGASGDTGSNDGFTFVDGNYQLLRMQYDRSTGVYKYFATSGDSLNYLIAEFTGTSGQNVVNGFFSVAGNQNAQGGTPRLKVAEVVYINGIPSDEEVYNYQQYVRQKYLIPQNKDPKTMGAIWWSQFSNNLYLNDSGFGTVGSVIDGVDCRTTFTDAFGAQAVYDNQVYSSTTPMFSGSVYNNFGSALVSQVNDYPATTDFTFFSRFNIQSSATDYRWLCYSDSGSGVGSYRWFIMRFNPGDFYEFDVWADPTNDAGFINVQAPYTSYNKWVNLCFRAYQDGSSYRIRLQDSEGLDVSNSFTYTSIPAATNPRIGQVQGGGYIAEQFWFDRKLSDDEVSDMFNYLNNKY